MQACRYLRAAAYEPAAHDIETLDSAALLTILIGCCPAKVTNVSEDLKLVNPILTDARQHGEEPPLKVLLQ